MKVSDWSEWLVKLKWYLISFKIISFATVVALLIFFWGSLWKAFINTVEVAKDLKEKGIVTEEGASDIIVKAQTILYDSTFGHGMLAVTAIVSAIIAIKGVGYVMDSKQTQEVVKKLGNGETKESLQKFLPKRD